MTTYAWTLHEYRDGAPVERLYSHTARTLNAASKGASQAVSLVADMRRTSLSEAYWDQPLVGNMKTREGGRRVFPFRDGTSVIAHIWREDERS